MLITLRKVATGLAAAALSVSGLVLAAPLTAHADTTVPVHIFTFNDFHGRLSGTPLVPPATDKNLYPNPVPFLYTIEKAALDDPENSMVISAGDSIGASEFASAIDHDNPTVQLLNLLADGTNFKASAVGNHEFDQGFADLANRINGTGGMTQTAWTYVVANITDDAGDIPAPLQPYYIYELGSGVKVAVIGAITQQTPSLVSPAGIAGLHFGDPVAAINKYADELKANGDADIVVADYHEGASTPKSLADAIAADDAFTNIANNTSNSVDVIVNGHTHMVYDWTDAQNNRPIVQAGNYGANVGSIDLTFDTATGKITSASAKNIPVAASVDVDLTVGNMAEINDAVNDLLGEANVLGQKPVGKVSAPITTAYFGGQWVDGVYQTTATAARDDRANESALATLAANSFLYAAQNSDAIGGADLGIINAGGGLRAELPASSSSTINFGDGTVTFAGANNIMPFGNQLWTVELTGEQIKQFLEEQWQSTQTDTAPSRPFLNTGVSDNVTYTVNTDMGTAEPCTLADKCAWDDANSHITSVFIDGAPLDPAHVYKVITLSFLIDGGDNYWVTPQGANAEDTGLLDRDAWIAYIGDMSAEAPIAPSFARASVVVSNLLPTTKPMASTVVPAGGSVSASLSRLDMTSIGSPANTTMSTYLAPLDSDKLGTKLATTPVTAPGDTAGCAAAGVPADLNPASNGCALLDVTIPADTPAGDYVLTAVAQPSGTIVRLPITVWEADATVADTSAPSPTGGAARLADGSDGYSVTVTITDADTHKPTAGVADLVSLDSRGTADVSDVKDNDDGTYTFIVTSKTPGHSEIEVYLNGELIGDPISVDFIGTSMTTPSVTVGDDATAVGLGFQPGEDVTVTVHSDPMDLGTMQADKDGSVTATFSTKGLATGRHTVEFSGVDSGTVSVDFEVLAAGDTGDKGTDKGASGDTKKDVPAGGSVHPSGSAGPLFALGLLALAGAALLGGRVVKRVR